MNNNQSSNLLNAILNAASLAASASATKSASAGIFSPIINNKNKQDFLNNQETESNHFCTYNPSCLNNHTNFNSNDDESFIKDNKLLHQIGTNLVDLSVCWHKMAKKEKCNKCGKSISKSSQNQNFCDKCIKKYNINQTLMLTQTQMEPKVEEEKQQKVKIPNQVEDSSIQTLIEKIEPIVDEHKTDDLTRKSYQEEFSSLIIKSTYNLTGFDASVLLEANKDQSPGKLADQIDFITGSSRSSSTSSSVNIPSK